MASVRGSHITEWADVSDHLLEYLECRELHDILGRLRGEPLLFTGEGVLSEALLGRGLAMLANLKKSGNCEGAWSATTDVLLDH